MHTYIETKKTGVNYFSLSTNRQNFHALYSKPKKHHGPRHKTLYPATGSM